jgi:ubiquinone biosynthesis protein
MPGSSLEGCIGQLVPQELHAVFFSKRTTTSERVNTIKALLQTPSGQLLRDELGKWIVQRLRVEYLVPETYAQWRPLVRDAMLFVQTHLSAARLAPKLVEQMDLPANTPPEVRLLRLIAKVPGLQKLGQVLARNRHLHPSLRRALSELENGIRDVNPEEIHTIILDELGPRVEACAVKIESIIFVEASVSAVVRFTWWNPAIRKRERGVFKVMKPYVPVYFAEDMHLLGKLAKFLGSKHREYKVAGRGVSDTFREVQELLRNEVHFRREQATLLKASRLYGSVPSVRVPRVIPSLCTSKITAMTEERGKKITDAVADMPAWRRTRVARQLIEALVAVPLSASKGKVMFHADPHAGNLLYDKRTGELVILDWALTEQLSHDQRRHLALLFLLVALRDPIGVCEEIHALSRDRGHNRRQRQLIIRDCVTAFFDQLPLARLPGAVDAMRLVERISYEGVRFPAPLIMMRKVLFTLDGILHDIAGPSVGMESVIVGHVLQNWMARFASFGSPLHLRDWIRVQFSTLLYAGRLWMQAAQPGPRPRLRGAIDKAGGCVVGS